MRVVELHGDMVAEGADVAMLLDVPAHEVEQRGGGEEIFLPQAKLLPRRRGVAGIEHLGDRLGADRIRERADIVAGVEGVELDRVGRARRPEPERVDVPPAPADDGRVEADRLDGLAGMPDVAHEFAVARDRLDPAAEADGVIDLGALEFPGIAVRQPVLGHFLLPAAADDLPEQAVVVADAVAVGGDGQRRHAVHEAGGETAEAAVAERGVRFDLAQGGEVDAELRERGGHRLDDADIRHRVEQHPADQEFEREIIDPLAVLFVDEVRAVDPAFDDDVAGRVRDRQEPVALARGLRVLAYGVGELGQHRGLQFLGVRCRTAGIAAPPPPNAPALT